MPHKGHDHGHDDMDDNYVPLKKSYTEKFDDEMNDADLKNYEASKKKLYLVSFVTVIFIIAQSIGGYLSGSIAIITDTAHLATDMIGFAISIFCLKLSQRDASKELTYGWHRSEIIGTLVSILFLVTVTMYLLKEAIDRAINLPPIEADSMLITAVAGLFFNLIQMQILHQGDGHYHLGGDDHDHGEEGHDHGHDHHHEGGHHDHGHSHEAPKKVEGEHGHSHDAKPKKREANINVSAAYCHALSDMIMSIGVIIAATIIYFKPSWRMADPICTFVFSFIVCVTVVPITKKCLHILMEGAPDKVNIQKLITEIKKVDPEMELNRLHVWSITNTKVAMSCQIKTKLDTRMVLKEVRKTCMDQFNMRHLTIQCEDANSEEHRLEQVAGEKQKYLQEMINEQTHQPSHSHGHHH